jgi:hypothetical protein
LMSVHGLLHSEKISNSRLSLLNQNALWDPGA